MEAKMDFLYYAMHVKWALALMVTGAVIIMVVIMEAE
jgi:hypothetical protein